MNGKSGWWKELQVSKQELRGAAAWLSILAIADALILLWPSNDEIPPEVWKPWADSLGKGTENVRYKKIHRNGVFSIPTASKQFFFNPMTVSADSLKQLGVSPWIAERLVKYRERGGRFLQPSDFDKIFGLKQKDKSLLLNYARFSAEHPETEPIRKREGIMGNIQQRVPGEKAGRIELNQADSSDWEQLPGIGPILASRIVKYRNRLGGFVRREQLLEVYGIDTALYLKLANRLQEETRPNELLHWQTTSYDTLSRHPYIGRFIAGKIIRFREQNKNYPERMSPQNWLFVDSLKMEKLRPYLSKP